MFAVQLARGKSLLSSHTMFAMLAIHKAWQMMVEK